MTGVAEAAAAATRRPFPARTGIAEVVRARSVTPLMRRITLSGPALADFFVDEPGEIVTLLWPAPGRGVVLPRDGWRFPRGVADAQHARNYTVRRWNAPARELEIDFVLHGDHGRAGAWAARARPGDEIGFAGPRTHWTAPDPAAGWTLLVADETGLPALQAIAEALPAGHPAWAIVEVADARERQLIHTAADLRERWLTRDGRPAGTTTLLADTVRALNLPGGRGAAWGGGEALAMRDVRRHLRDERGLRAAGVSVLGYWKHAGTERWD